MVLAGKQDLLATAAAAAAAQEGLRFDPAEDCQRFALAFSSKVQLNMVAKNHLETKEIITVLILSFLI